MKPTIETLESLIGQLQRFFALADEEFLRRPYAPGKWSRKQILGHLIDSALNNLTRFTEIGHQQQPYAFRAYDQDQLVKINNYQEMETAELVQLWQSLNKQIVRVISSAGEDRLNLKVLFPDGQLADLRFIMHDYPQHMRHHIAQITSQ